MNIEELVYLLQASGEKLSKDPNMSAEAAALFKSSSRVIGALIKERAALKVELNAYTEALRKIADEDFRGNRPYASVLAERVLVQFKGGKQ